jgi:ribosomal-protein-alanine N-acetyltransferase
VLIRPPRPEDAAEFTALVCASQLHYGGWIAPPDTQEAFAAYVERGGSDDFEGLLVCRRSDGVILGAANLSQIFRGNFRSCYLGYHIAAAFAGRGYMREALPLVLRHAFRTLELHRVEANVQPGNTASRALVRSVGFRLEGYSPRYLKVNGRWRDHERWAILREEWYLGERRARTGT